MTEPAPATLRHGAATPATPGNPVSPARFPLARPSLKAVAKEATMTGLESNQRVIRGAIEHRGETSPGTGRAR